MARTWEVKVVTDNIRYYRMKAHLTQDELGQRVNLRGSTICRLEAGGRDITIQKLLAIAIALRVDVRDFFKHQ